MLHSYCHELPGRAPFFGGPAQSFRIQLAHRLRPVAQPLTSVAAFQPKRNTAQRTTIPQQVSRPKQSAVVSLGPASTAVNNVQVLEGGVRSVPREPNVHKHRRRRNLKVAVDVDEVLGRFLHSLNKFCHEEYGLLYDIPDYSVYEFAKIWNCSTDESNHIVHDFFKSRHFAAGILPIPGALHSLQRLSQSCDLVVVTSRQHCIQQPTLDWVDKHFPGIFSEVHFGNHWALEGKSKAKSEICRDIGATVLIDDNPRYAVECATAGIDVLLYDWNDSYPWSKTSDGPEHERIRRVRDWIEVEDALALLALDPIA